MAVMSAVRRAPPRLGLRFPALAERRQELLRSGERLLATARERKAAARA